MQKNKHQQEVCNVVINLMAKRKNETLQIVGIPDAVERNKKAVDLHIKGIATNTEYHIEHTLMESFPGQITDGVRFLNLLVPIEKSIARKLPPSHFYLTVAAGAVTGATDSKKIQGELEKWIIEKAPVLFAEASKIRRYHQIREVVPNVPFEVVLSCEPKLEKCFYVARSVSSEKVEEERRKRMQIALVNKCPKLKAAKLKNNSTSVLILESNDIALANHHFIAAAFSEELNKRTDDIPDEVYLVETDIPSQWTAWILKEGLSQYPDISTAGPHYVERSSNDFVPELGN